ncbi:P-loop containing nucleoside triphosphate hydrolase protein, partial [Phlyctochytrium arcticum]
IIYCASAADCITLADALETASLSVGIFHGQLRSEERDEAMAFWRQDTFSIMIATTAFGVGVSKSNVRFVIQAKLPASMMDLLQESGRAGRDNQPAR